MSTHRLHFYDSKHTLKERLSPLPSHIARRLTIHLLMYSSVHQSILPPSIFHPFICSPLLLAQSLCTYKCISLTAKPPIHPLMSPSICPSIRARSPFVLSTSETNKRSDFILLPQQWLRKSVFCSFCPVHSLCMCIAFNLLESVVRWNSLPMAQSFVATHSPQQMKTTLHIQFYSDFIFSPH